MKIKINGIQRDATIMQVPDGSFCVVEGCSLPFYPLFCALCEPTEEEAQIGDIIVCPISKVWHGYSMCEIGEIANLFELRHLHVCVNAYFENYDGTLCDAVEYIMDDLQDHNVRISRTCKDIITRIENGSIINLNELKDEF